MNTKHDKAILDNPVFGELWDRRANAFNSLSDRFEGLKLPDKDYEELLSGLREIDNATAKLTTFCAYWYVQPILIRPVDVIPVIGAVNN